MDRALLGKLALIPLILVPLFAVVVAGAALALAPKEFAGGGDKRIAASPDRVWAMIHDPAHHPMSAPKEPVVTMGAPVNGLPAWTEDLGHSVVHVVTVEAAPDHAVYAMTDSVTPVSTTWTITVAPDGEGTQVTITQVGRVDGDDLTSRMVRASLWAGSSQTGPMRYLVGLERGAAAPQ